MSKKTLGQQLEDQGDSLASSANQQFQDDSILPVQFSYASVSRCNHAVRDRVEILENTVGMASGSISASAVNSDAVPSNASTSHLQHGRDVALSRDSQLLSSVSSGRKHGSVGSTTTPIAKRFMKAGASMRSKIQQHPAFSSRSGNTDASRTKVSSGSPVSCLLLHSYIGHLDGLWEVCACPTRAGLLGTASADRTACVFDVNSGTMLQQYVGHAGSVNSIRFAETPQTGDLWALTASGDQTAHLWCVTAKPLPMTGSTQFPANVADSEADEFDGVTSTNPAQQQHLATSTSVDFYPAAGDDSTDYAGGSMNRLSAGGRSGFPTGGVAATTTRDALRKFRSHSSVVSCADFLGGATDFIITASWDRTACLYDVHTGEQVNCLSGHDDELTHVSSHRQLRLFATSSRDSTLRLWDFRDPIHSVSVFQGHTDVVTSTVFTPASDGNIVVSGSDDRTVKTWDLRNMRSAISVARFKSGVNRLSVCRNQVGVPLDNGQIYILDLSTGKLVRLPLLSKLNKFTTSSTHQHTHPHSHRPHHQQQQYGSTSSSQNTARRIVTSVAWLESNMISSLNSSRPRTSSRTQQNPAASAGEAIMPSVDAAGSDAVAAHAAVTAAVQAACSNPIPISTASVPVQQQRSTTVVVPTAAAAGVKPSSSTADGKDIGTTSTQSMVSTNAPSLTVPSSATLPPTAGRGGTTVQECNFFSSSFAQGVAYGWRLENVYGY